MKPKNLKTSSLTVLDSIDRLEQVHAFLPSLTLVALIISKQQIWVIQDIASLDPSEKASTNSYSDPKSSNFPSTSPISVELMLIHHMMLSITSTRYRMMISLSWPLMVCMTTSMMTMLCTALSQNHGRNMKRSIT